MNRSFASFVIAALALIAGPDAVTSAQIRHHDAGIDILVNGVPQKHYEHQGRWYVEALKGREYAIRLRNPYPVRVAVALSVDGLNTIDARHTTAGDARKWVIEPYQTITISGWQVNSAEARRFEFTTEARSYGQALGQTANLGVISAVFFKERAAVMSRESLRERNEGQARARARRSAGRAGRIKSIGRHGSSIAGRRRVRRHGHGTANRPRGHANRDGSRAVTRKDSEHPLRIPRATRQAGCSAGHSDSRPAAAARTRPRLRTWLQSGSAYK